MRCRPALLLLLATVAVPCSAQTAPKVRNADDRIVLDLVESGAAGIDIAPDRRADLAACDGADSAGLARAIRNCWPVLQSYRTFAPLRPAVARWESLPRDDQKRDTPESREVLKIADTVIADAGARTWPAQDPPLMIAYLTKGLVAIAQDDLPSFVAHFASARDIMTSSAIRASWLTADLPRIEDQIAQAEEMIDQLAWLEAAKAAVGEKKK